MNTYIYAGNSSLLVVKDNDLNSVSSIRNHYLNIDWAWVIEEDGILKFNGKEYDVKAGDIVLVCMLLIREVMMIERLLS